MYRLIKNSICDMCLKETSLLIKFKDKMICKSCKERGYFNGK